MRNIFILPTDKLSRVYSYNGKLGLAKSSQYGSDSILNQNIYITSNEEIKEGDWVLFSDRNLLYKVEYTSQCFDYNNDEDCKKIILTTDVDLIKNGVQIIPDEFLEWFVKNPSCEEVEVIKEQYHQFVGNTKLLLKPNYKIIIPKQQIPPKKVEIHLKNPNECEHNLEVGCIKDVCDCYTLVSSEEELLSFILLAENRAQALRMLKQWKQGFYSDEDLEQIRKLLKK